VGYRLRSPFSRTSRESRSSCESRGGRWSPFHRASSSRGEPEIPSTPPPGLSTAGCGMSFADLPANLLRESRDDDDRMSVARRFITNKMESKKMKMTNDELYESCLAVRAQPFKDFVQDLEPKWPLVISSISEGRLLKALGLSQLEQCLVEGLHQGDDSPFGGDLTDAQLSASARARLAHNPTKAVGDIQRKTRSWLLRPFPLGLRFSGNNMSPLPCWLAGAQSVALNMSPIKGVAVDLAVMLHFALFDNSSGYVLKPAGMLQSMGISDAFFPLPRKNLDCKTLELISLHSAPKRGEQRPCLSGQHHACHKYLPDLSGKSMPPKKPEPSSLGLTISLHPFGGFCAVSETLPLPEVPDIECFASPAVSGNGMNPHFDKKMHLVAAEPDATFVHIALSDGGVDVAFEAAVLGRLGYGFRVFRMRSLLGTRIQLCVLFVRISFGRVLNMWETPRQLRIQSAMMEARLDEVQGSDSRRGTQETYDLLQEFNAFNRRVSQGSVAVERRQSIGLGAGVDGPDGRGLQRLNHGQAGRDLQRENSREGARTHRRNSGVPFFLTESHSERVERMDEDDTNESSTKR